jgi:hypothetical protein
VPYTPRERAFSSISAAVIALASAPLSAFADSSDPDAPVPPRVFQRTSEMPRISEECPGISTPILTLP